MRVSARWTWYGMPHIFLAVVTSSPRAFIFFHREFSSIYSIVISTVISRYCYYFAYPPNHPGQRYLNTFYFLSSGDGFFYREKCICDSSGTFDRKADRRRRAKDTFGFEDKETVNALVRGRIMRSSSSNSKAKQVIRYIGWL